MQYLSMVHSREDQGQPPAALFEAMGRFIEEMTAGGRLVTTGGLLPSTEGVTVAVRGRDVIVSDGPFAEATEVVGGYAILEAESMDEVIELMKPFLQLHRDHWPEWEGYTEIRPIAG